MVNGVSSKQTKYINPMEFHGLYSSIHWMNFETLFPHALDSRDPQYHRCAYYVRDLLDNLISHPYTIQGLNVYFTNQEDYNLVRLIYG